MPVVPKDMLFGRMAVAKGFLTKEQLEECVRFQVDRAANCPLGLVMIDKGFLTSEQLQALVDAQKLAFQAVDPLRLRKIEDTIFGQIAVKENMVATDEVNQALRDQALEEEVGRARRIGEFLVERGCLTEAQVEEVLEIQRRRTVVCSSCGAQFNVEKLEPGKRFKCGKCQATLEVPVRPAPTPAAEVVPDAPASDGGLGFPDSGSEEEATAGRGDLEGLEEPATRGEFAGLDTALGQSTVPEDLEPLDNKPTRPVPEVAAAEAVAEAPAEAVPEEEDEPAGIESFPTMAMPSIGAEIGESTPRKASPPIPIENMRTLATPGVGRVSKAPAPVAQPAASGGISEEDLEEIGLDAMHTMAMPGLGHLVQKHIANPANSVPLEIKPKQAGPRPASAASKGIDPNTPISFACTCGRRITAPAKMAGRAGKCPGCGKRVMLPKALAQQVAGMRTPAAKKTAPPPPLEFADSPAPRPAKSKEKPGRPAKSAEPSLPAAGAEGTNWEVTYVAGSLDDAKDAGIRGEGTFTLSEAGLLFAGAGRPLGLLTFAGAPLSLAAGGTALYLQLVPQMPAIAGGVAGALVLTLIDFLLRRGKSPEPLNVARTNVKQYKSEPKPRVSIAISLGFGGTVCVTMIPRSEDRKKLLQALAEMF